MSDDIAGPTTGSGTRKTLVKRMVPTMWIGVASVAVGLMVGVVMMVRSREAVCPNDTTFLEGETDFRCFEHPQALTGIAVFAAFMGLATVIYLIWTVIAWIDTQSPTQQ